VSGASLDQSPPSDTEVKNEWSSTSTPATCINCFTAITVPLLVCYPLDLSYLSINTVSVSTCVEFLKKITEFVVSNL
jgi:hypothetical protein